MSPCPRILMRREAPSGAQPQELADRARYPESPRRGPRVLRTPAPGSPPLRRRSDPPSLRQRLGRTPKETGSRSRMVGGGALAGEKTFGSFPTVRGPQGTRFPKPTLTPPNRGPRAQPGVSRLGGPHPGQRILPGPPLAPRSVRPRGCRQARGSGWLGAAGPGTPPRTGDRTAPQSAQRRKDPVGREARKWPEICH